MTRKMYDSLYHVDQIPTDFDLLMAYVNGALPASSGNYAAMRARFPDAHIVSVTTNGDEEAVADVCDCENGDYTPAKTARWSKNMIALGRRPTAYSDRATRPALVVQLHALGLALITDVDWLVSTLDGTMTVAGAVGVQYSNNGGFYDTTVVYDDAWHPSSVVPDPVPLPEDEHMGIIVACPGQPTAHLIGGKMIPLDQASIDALVAAGVPITRTPQLSPATYSAYQAAFA